jgi:hypothetical protein
MPLETAMRLFRRLTCAVRGHVPLESLPTEPPPRPSAITQLQSITGINLSTLSNGSYSMGGAQINVGPHNTPGLNGQTVKLGGSGQGLSVHTAGPVLQIDYPGATCKMSICARCAGVYWHSAPNLPALTSSKNVPILQELFDWNKRETWERQQRETNEAAARLYKQYQMVLKLAGPTCEAVDE